MQLPKGNLAEKSPKNMFAIGVICSYRAPPRIDKMFVVVHITYVRTVQYCLEVSAVMHVQGVRITLTPPPPTHTHFGCDPIMFR